MTLKIRNSYGENWLHDIIRKSWLFTFSDSSCQSVIAMLTKNTTICTAQPSIIPQQAPGGIDMGRTMCRTHVYSRHLKIVMLSFSNFSRGKDINLIAFIYNHWLLISFF